MGKAEKKAHVPPQQRAARSGAEPQSQRKPRAVNAPRFKRPEPATRHAKNANLFACLSSMEEKILPQEIRAMPAVYFPPVPPQMAFQSKPVFPPLSAGVPFVPPAEFNPDEWKPVRPKKAPKPQRQKQENVVEANPWPGRRRGKISSHLAYIKDAQSGARILLEGNHLESQSFRVGDTVPTKSTTLPGKNHAQFVCAIPTKPQFLR